MKKSPRKGSGPKLIVGPTYTRLLAQRSVDLIGASRSVQRMRLFDEKTSISTKLIIQIKLRFHH